MKNHESEKVFTQDEVNAIVQKRLKEERDKLQEERLHMEKELEGRAFKVYVHECLHSKGLPATLADALDVSSKEAFERSLGVVESLLARRQEGILPPPRAGYGGGKETLTKHDPDSALRKAMGLEKG